ncbi:MAG: hypothetical protein JWN25_2121 [Verrucomicrobiales bacterium]|nr:hypothetical protein [Verrucomicrobiales bacterium]
MAGLRSKASYQDGVQFRIVKQNSITQCIYSRATEGQEEWKSFVKMKIQPADLIIVAAFDKRLD